MDMYRGITTTVLAAVLAGCGGGTSGESADEPAPGLHDVVRSVGKTPREAGLWDGEPLRSRLRTLLGERFDALLETLEDAAPIAERDGVVYVLGKKRDRLGITAAAVVIDPGRDAVAVRMKYNRVVQEFVEVGEEVTFPEAAAAFFSEVDREAYAIAPDTPDPAAAPETPDAEPAPIPPPTAAAPQGSIVRGYLVFGPGMQSLTDCGRFANHWVEGGPGVDIRAVQGVLQVEPLAPLYVEVRGVVGEATPALARDGYDHRMLITEIRRARRVGAGPDCAEDLSFEFRASGHEPSWRVTVTRDRITLESSDGPAALEFPYAAPIRSERRLSYASTDEGGRRIEVILDHAQCVDQDAGEYLSWRAEVRQGGRTYRGCARRGES